MRDMITNSLLMRISSAYLPTLRQTLVEAGVTELLFTCDDQNGLQAGIPLDGTLRAINLQEDPQGHISALRIHQPNRPVLVAEYWTGWFDWWGDKELMGSTFLAICYFNRIWFRAFRWV